MASDGQAVSGLPDTGVPRAQQHPNGTGTDTQIPPASDANTGYLNTSAPLAMETENDSNSETTSIPSEDSVEATTGTAQASARMGESVLPSRKRKSPDGSAEPVETSAPEGNQKKVKLDLELATDHAGQHVLPQVKDSSQGRDKSLLPPEIWHHIFTFCPPKSLANLLSVNKLFNHYLDPSSSVLPGIPVSVAHGVLSPLKPNAIWQASRRLFWPHMPVPLRSRTELEMWRLACSPVCQACRKTDGRGPPSHLDSSQPGPGPDGVAVIWPFARCLCLSCLLKTSIKEVDLQLLPTIPSAILPALPFVLLSRDLVVMPGSTFDSTQPPSGLQLTKLYPTADVEALREELAAVKDMGPGTVDEWLKGLTGRGNELRHEASKWEKWEASGGLAKMRKQLYPGYEPTPKIQHQQPDLPVSPPLPCSSSRSPVSTIVPHPSLPSRPDWTTEQVSDLKAARRADIERRAMQLDPPLSLDVLRHLPAFRAASQITAPLDESAWAVLKPRLLAQLEEAKTKEKETTEPGTMSVAIGRQLETTLATTKEARDLIDKEWEEIQAPLRAKISGYADEVIRDKWDKGKKVSTSSCSKFATEVLIYTRKRFYEEVAKDAAAARAAGRSPVVDPQEGPFTQKLTLENMKWIFDTKIKPHTEPYRKELFYCNGCDGHFKSFGFEGVVQHYAAKHTSALSLGSIVVHWRAEWPEHPPFASEVRPAKSHFYNQGPVPAPFPHSTPFPPNTYHYQPVPPPPTTPLNYPSQPGPGYTAAPYAEHYSQPPPPQPYGQPTYTPPFVPPGGYGPQQPFAPPPNPYPSYPPPPGPYAHPIASADPVPGYVPPVSVNYPYNYGPHQANGQPVYPGPAPGQYPATYQTKLEDIARNSREVWNALGGVKDLPGGARVFATVHHLVKRYRARFYETPPLTMFIDGLSNNKDMRPVRNINGLVCKTCHFGLGNAASVEQERKSFSLPQLANHFQSKHIDPMARQMSPQLDWIVDMVYVPDLQSIFKILPSAGEPQRSLLSDAFPEPLQTRGLGTTGHPSYPHQEHHPGGYPDTSTGVPNTFHEPNPQLERLRTGNPSENGHHHQSRQHLHEGYGSGTNHGPAQLGRPEGPPLERGFFPGRTPLSPEPVKVAQNSDARRSPQEPHRARHENPAPSYKKKGGKNRRGKPQERGEVKKRLLEKETQREEHQAQREEEEIKAMWAADRAGAVRAHNSANTNQEETRDNVYPVDAKHQQPLNAVAHPVVTGPEQDATNIMAALEQHLKEGYPLGSAKSEQPVQSDQRYLYARGSALPTEARNGSRAYARYGEGRNRSRSPTTHETRYYGATPARDRSVPPRQTELAHYSRPAPPAERSEASYDRYRVHSDHPEHHRQQSNDRRYELPLQRFDGSSREHSAQPEQLRYSEHGSAPTRGPVELYEIVHVIDERGEYYIRRPVRREVEPPRVVYEGLQRAYRDVDPYAAYEPVSGPPGPRPIRLESRRPDTRVDPTYEEYNPRYPRV